MEKNTASARKPLTARAPYLQLVKGDSAPIKTCACGREIDGDHEKCYQCFTNQRAEKNGVPLFPCMNECGAQTAMNFCIHCHKNLSVADRRSAVNDYEKAHPDDARFYERDAAMSTKKTGAKTETQRGGMNHIPVGYELKKDDKESKPEEKPAAKPEPVTTTIDLGDGETLEFREANGNELVIVRRVLAEIEEEEERIRHAEEVQRQMDEARKAREAETARVAALRAPLLKTLADMGREGLKMMGVLVINHPRIDVDGDKYDDPHFTVRVKDDTARPDGYREFDLFDKEAEKELKEARAAHAKDLEEAAKARREAEAAARRAKHAPKANEPRPGHSSGDSGNGKHGKGGRNGKGGKGKK